MKAKGRVIGVALAVLGGAVVIAPLAVNRLVENAGAHGMSMPMACDLTARAEIFVGAAILALAILHLALKARRAKIATSVLLALGGLSALLFPTVWTGVCAQHDMACRMITLPSLIVIGILVIIFALIYPVSEIAEIAKRRKEAPRKA
jgi:uncharacterized membrane protein